MPVGFPSFSDAEELFLNPLGDLAPAAPDADPVHGSNRRDLGRGASEEGFVGHIQDVSQQRLFPYDNSEIPAQG